MKTLHSFNLAAVLLALLATLLAGCKTTPKVDWEARLGTFTFDQAVAENGPPDKQTTLSDGQKVADWYTHTSQAPSFGIGVGSFGRGGGVGVGESFGGDTRVHYLRLTFGPDGRLVHWSRN